MGRVPKRFRITAGDKTATTNNLAEAWEWLAWFAAQGKNATIEDRLMQIEASA